MQTADREKTPHLSTSSLLLVIDSLAIKSLESINILKEYEQTVSMKSVVFFHSLVALSLLAGVCSLECKEKDDNVGCHFNVPRKEQGTHIKNFCFNDGDERRICVEANIKVTVEDKKSVKEATVQPLADISIGDEVYEKLLLSTYPESIRRALESFERSNSDFDRSEALADLGAAYNAQSIASGDETNRKLALNALNMGKNLLEQLKRQDKIPPPDSLELYLHSLGNIYFMIAETHALSLDPDDASLADTYFEQAHRIFEKLLEEASDYIFEREVFREVELAWADCSLRIGISTLSPSKQQDYDGNDLDEQEQIERIKESTRRTRTALDYFQTAELVYRKAARKEKDKGTLLVYQKQLATALQNIGTTRQLLGDLDGNIQSSVEALGLFELVQREYPMGSVEMQSNVIIVADLLYSLSDSYLQKGAYDRSMEMYTRAMKYYSDYDIQVPLAPSAIDPSDQALYDLEQSLKDYRDMLKNDGIPPSESPLYKGPDVVYDEDPAYEADLYATIGALHIARDELVEGEAALLEAIDLYSINETSEGRALADVYFNLGSLTLQGRSFDESIEYRRKALDLYQTLVAEGENPLEGAAYSSALVESRSVNPDGSSRSEDESSPKEESTRKEAGSSTSKPASAVGKKVPMVLLDSTGIASLLSANTTGQEEPENKD